MKELQLAFLKPLLFGSIISIAQAGKAQTLLGADSNKITRQMISQGAELQSNRVEESFVIEGSYHVLFFSFPNVKKVPKIVYEKFYITDNNKCVKYDILYLGEEWYKKLIDSLRKTATGIKQMNDSLNWVSRGKDYNIYLLKSIPIQEKNNASCMLEIEKSNLKRRPNPFKKNE